MADFYYGPRDDWRTFTIRIEGKTLKEFKADWYKLNKEEDISTDIILCFKNGEKKLVSSDIYWGNIRNPENFKYIIDGAPAGKVFSQVESIDFMHCLQNHPACAEFWIRDESGAYRSFDFRNARPVMNELRNVLVSSAPNDRDNSKASLSTQINSAASRTAGSRSVPVENGKEFEY